MRVATLDDATEWTLSLAFAKDGSAPVDITARVKFSEDEGYEPPQGRVVLQVSFQRLCRPWHLSQAVLYIRISARLNPCSALTDAKLRAQGDSSYLGTTSQSFWKLGEDPAKEGFDKAGFWIWGLFEEPAYPFFFFEMDVVKEIVTSTGTIPVGYATCSQTEILFFSPSFPPPIMPSVPP
jgi:hypothetical protein